MVAVLSRTARISHWIAGVGANRHAVLAHADARFTVFVGAAPDASVKQTLGIILGLAGAGGFFQDRLITADRIGVARILIRKVRAKLGVAAIFMVFAALITDGVFDSAIKIKAACLIGTDGLGRTYTGFTFATQVKAAAIRLRT